MNCLYYPFRLAGCPQLQLPVVRSPVNGMPVSLQLVGRPIPRDTDVGRERGREDSERGRGASERERRASDGKRDMMVLQVGQAIERLYGPQYPSPMELVPGDVNAL